MRTKDKQIFRLTCSFANTFEEQKKFSLLQKALKREGFRFEKHSHPDTNKQGLIMINLEFPTADDTAIWKIHRIVKQNNRRHMRQSP